jgi:uncharacterized protein YjbI with pentapeptide repeats
MFLLAAGLVVLLCWVAAAAGWVTWPAVGAWVAARTGSIAALLVALGFVGAAGRSWARGVRVRTRARPRVALSWWVVAGALFVVALVSWGVTAWLLREAAFAKDIAATRVDAIKSGLTIGAGTGGVFALLLLAVRRQWHQELTAQDTVDDATERRVTELYSKAVEQLDSEKAPVRLGGLYALERLAQASPTHRQTVVNVLCAYLRMPYQPLEPEPPRAVASTGGASDDRARRVQEREVRLTAQRILADHLRPGSDPQHPAVTFWPESTLDLTGAVLIDVDLSHTQPGTVRFDGATFTGAARFDGVTVTGEARFDGATFTGAARFGEAIFTEEARFDGATFTGAAQFGETIFTEDAQFGGATFTGAAQFGETTFNGDAGFGRSTFNGDAGFDGATVTGAAWFGGATFTGASQFGGATFTGASQFGGATFTGAAWFGGATFTGNAWFGGATFTGNAWFGRATFTREAGFHTATFTKNARFDGATFTKTARRACFADSDIARSLPSDLRWAPDDGSGWLTVVASDGGGGAGGAEGAAQTVAEAPPRPPPPATEKTT